MKFKKENFVRLGVIPAVFALSVSLSACGNSSKDDITTTGTTSITTTETTTVTTTVATTATTTAPTTQTTTKAKETVTLGMQNALKSAKNYLSFMAFSYNGLIDQLKYEQYSDEEAIYAAENCGADWNEQAAKSAENYLSIMSFSRGELIDQLIYEGFTQQQAEYGVSAVGY